ncbi:long-chain-fatty-acid--CoA ligase [Virgisporangium aurantiacum]|uniref:Acyl-CoA synthetase n=1 Tax=Virgisporangium aurantiacum TaxID=175570 RepID=A0A8J3Z2T5_9ACTN|nr:long-chain-fatty-acid--CoA ligase [Virgisporangium aurantiacum]GIJ55667.1 acyl-CoA synthetase [Virgisporangium aurantiacum]
MFSIADVVREAARVRPDAVAVSGQGRRSTFGELDERSSRVAAGLVALGVQPGDRVAYVGLNRTDVLDIVAGASKAGAVPVPVNFRLAGPELAAVLTDSGAVVLFGEQPQVDLLAPHDVPALRRTIVLDSDLDSGYDAWFDAQPSADPGRSPGPDDLACLIYSSGTTGLPKGVMIRNRNLHSMLDVARRRWQLDPGDASFNVSPYFHVLGFSWAVHSLRQGAIIAQVRDAAPGALLPMIAGEKARVAVLVPALIDIVLRSPGLDEADLSSLRLVLYGSAPISVPLLTEATKRLGVAMEQSYGLTEVAGGATFLSPSAHERALAGEADLLRSCGQPDPGSELRIVDPSTLEDVPVGSPGEVLIRSAQVMAGYWNRPEETAHSLLPDGWLRTGDVGYLDASGYLYLVDRAKDMIVSGGENIYPAEVERALIQHPSVAEVAVVGAPSARWGESPVAVVVLEPAATVDSDALIAWCRDRLAHYKCPVAVNFVDALPRNASGKVLRRVLREPLWDGHVRRIG